MYIVGKTFISDAIAEEFFVCDLEKCKGACCVEGDLGAPLTKEETHILEKILDDVKPYLSNKGLEVLEKKGAFVRDDEGDFSTPTIDDRECVYAFYDKRGILKCGIEQAYKEGKIDFQKPISCHLYPIRVLTLAEQEEEALNYHQWDICDPACHLGKSLSKPIYQFLKEALIRKYGEAWYQNLEAQIIERQALQDKSS